jgi:hypothetical protein
MKRHVLRNLVVTFIVIGTFSIAVAAFGQQVSKARHPNLAAAQELIQRAINRVTAAQDANEFDMGGHAAKAKKLLDEAYVEIKLAAETANQ